VETEPTILSPYQIRAALVEWGILEANVQCAGATYLLLSEADVHDRVGPECVRILAQSPPPQEGARECRQISRDIVSWVERWHAEQGKSEHAVAFGTIVLPSRQHECCVAIHESDAGIIYAKAYEPQTGLLPLDLTLEERKEAGLCQF